MKTILKPLFILFAAVAIVAAGSYAFFSDREARVGNTFAYGTIDLTVNGQDRWQDVLVWDNVMPGSDREAQFRLENKGSLPARVWQKIYNLQADDNGVNEPEQEWYDRENGGAAKNDLDTAVRFAFEIENQIIIPTESEVKIGQIADGYIYLGLLPAGGTIDVLHAYYLPAATGNWAQTDRLAMDIEFLALEEGAPEPGPAWEFMENKNLSTWNPIADRKLGLLKYFPVGQTFDYAYTGLGNMPGTDYCLIYYADGYPGNHPGYYFGHAVADTDGIVAISGSPDLGFPLPAPTDGNFPSGDPEAKIWQVECSTYNQSTRSIISWNATNYFFEYWPVGIKYAQGDAPNYDLPADAVATREIMIDEPAGDTASQYGYQFDYSSAQVKFAYDTPATTTLKGRISAAGLKPFATYQAKFEGKPACQYAGAGNDAANEYIGYLGRWTCVSCGGDPAARNRTDAQYEANKLLPDNDPARECIAGYWVWDYFTALADGSAVKDVVSDNSYHVLWCGGGVCDTAANNSLYYPDPAHPSVAFCPPSAVDGEIERGVCGGTVLAPGAYDVVMVLTEESFHQGNWASVLKKDLSFEIE